MKELSTEQKAKAYDEAIERAKKVLLDCTSEEQKVVEYITPELAESEDEKIRKELLGQVRKLLEMYDTLQTEKEYSKVQSWIAWLEKQEIKEHDVDVFCEDRYGCVNHCPTKLIEEQKPTDKVEPKFKIGQIIKKEGFNLGFTIAKIEDDFYYNDEGDYFPFTDQDNWILVEQNHAWSEEDKRILTTLINYLEEHGGGIDGYECIFLADWLKSLKNRVQPQPQSYERNRLLVQLEEWLDEYVSNLTDVDTATLICSFTNYLDNKLPKSLRPQSQWKPSEEQMEALKSSTYCQNEQMSKVLFELYQDLKKLNGE